METIIWTSCLKCECQISPNRVPFWFTFSASATNIKTCLFDMSCKQWKPKKLQDHALVKWSENNMLILFLNFHQWLKGRSQMGCADVFLWFNIKKIRCFVHSKLTKLNFAFFLILSYQPMQIRPQTYIHIEHTVCQLA